MGEAAMDDEAIADACAADAREKDAFLRRDAEALAALWHAEIVVNAPNSRVMTGAETLDRLRQGHIYHLQFERTIEHAQRFGTVVMVMGEERIFDDWGPFAGRQVRRRFTNMWCHDAGRWQMVARHASIDPRDVAGA
jgi:ketosteroid isomerase-like protein